MMSAATHRIRQQRWEIRVSDVKLAFRVRTELCGRLESDLQELFEQAFDALNTGSERVHIPKLVLQLRVSSLDDLATALPAAIQKQLDQLLLERGPLKKDSERGAAEKGQQLEDLLRYLHSGALTWTTAQQAAAQVAPLAQAAVELVREWRSQAARVRPLMPAAFEQIVPFFFRWLQLLPEGVRQECSASLTTVGHGVAQPAHARLSGALHAILRHQALAEHGTRLIEAVRLALAWATTFPADAQLVREVLAMPGMDAATAGALGSLLEWEGGVQAALEPAPLGVDDTAETKQRQPRFRPNNAAQGPLPTAVLPATAPQPDQVNSAEDTAELEAIYSREIARPLQVDPAPGLWVQAAGLVLLHPFLPKLLATLGVVDPGGESIAPSQLPRAAAALHWLAWGRAEVFEFELGCIKVLLGLRPEDPLPLSAGLVGEAEREESQALLEAAISHWSVLGSTSIAGLQTSFLQRAGLLRFTELGWQLHVEPASFDVLLTQLPWSFGTLKLKWMAQPLFTEWGAS